MSRNWSSAAVVIGALRVNIYVMFMLQHLFLAVMSSNRAKSLYERHGLQVVDEKSGCCCCDWRFKG